MTTHHVTIMCACGHRFSDRHDCDQLASLPSAVAALQAERDALRTKVERVEALHQLVANPHPISHPGWCPTCCREWPCVTALALRGES